MTKPPKRESYRVTIRRPSHLRVEDIRKRLHDALGDAIPGTVELIRKSSKPWWKVW